MVRRATAPRPRTRSGMGPGCTCAHTRPAAGPGPAATAAQSWTHVEALDRRGDARLRRGPPAAPRGGRSGQGRAPSLHLVVLSSVVASDAVLGRAGEPADLGGEEGGLLVLALALGERAPRQVLGRRRDRHAPPAPRAAQDVPGEHRQAGQRAQDPQGAGRIGPRRCLRPSYRASLRPRPCRCLGSCLCRRRRRRTRTPSARSCSPSSSSSSSAPVRATVPTRSLCTPPLHPFPLSFRPSPTPRSLSMRVCPLHPAHHSPFAAIFQIIQAAQTASV